MLCCATDLIRPACSLLFTACIFLDSQFLQLVEQSKNTIIILSGNSDTLQEPRILSFLVQKVLSVDVTVVVIRGMNFALVLVLAWY